MKDPHVMERRKSLRIPVAARVTFTENNREEIWFTEDIAEGGLFLKAESPPAIGAVLQLEIALPGLEELIKVKGEIVRRHEGNGCGVRFLRVTAKQRKILQQFIDSAEAKTESQGEE